MNDELEINLNDTPTYNIEITYYTGDSVNGSSKYVDTLGFDFKSLSIAKENIIAIKEHYDLYRYIDNNDDKSVYKEIEKYKDRFWIILEQKLFFIKDKNINLCRAIDESNKSKYNADELIYLPDKDSLTYSINLKLDDGSLFKTSTGMWIGYFESLEKLKIIVKQDEYL